MHSSRAFLYKCSMFISQLVLVPFLLSAFNTLNSINGMSLSSPCADFTTFYVLFVCEFHALFPLPSSIPSIPFQRTSTTKTISHSFLLIKH